MKKFKIIIGVLGLFFIPIYLVCIHPIAPEIYFNYKTQYQKYKNGKIKFYIVNSNPGHFSDSYSFKVSIDLDSQYYGSCSLNDFDWDLIRKSDNVLVFSTQSKTGIVNPDDYFENKIEGSLFKGISSKSGEGSLGAHDFQVNLTVSPNNKCGINSDELFITKTMRLKRSRMTAWDAAMSV